MGLLGQRLKMGEKVYIFFFFFSSAAASAHSTELEGIIFSLSTFLISDAIDGSVSHWIWVRNYQ